MESIRDGKGRGYLAGVNDNGFLECRSIEIPQEHYHAEAEANCFVTTFEHVTVSGGVKEIVGYFKYTGANNVVVSRFGYNSNSAGRTAMYIYVAPEGISGGLAKSLYNTNAGSKYNIDATLLHTEDGTEPINYTGLGTKLWEVYMGYEMMPYVELGTDNAFILQPGSEFAIVAKSASAGDKVGANIFIFEDTHHG